jgi:hypothetical protein
MHELTDRLSTAKVLNITGSTVSELARIGWILRRSLPYTIPEMVPAGLTLERQRPPTPDRDDGQRHAR